MQIVSNSDDKNAIICRITNYKPKGIIDEKFTKWSHVLNTDYLRSDAVVIKTTNPNATKGNSE